MQSLLVVSVVGNVILAVTCAVLARQYAWAIKGGQKDLDIARERNIELTAMLGELRSHHAAICRVAAESIVEIRRDISRNYEHVHDGGVLDLIAHLFSSAKFSGEPLYISDGLAAEVRAAGGDQYIGDNGVMMPSAALQFAWHMHSQSRAQSERMFPIVVENCEHTNRAQWLSKMLVIWERVCDHDTAQAIRVLSEVVDQWRFTRRGAQQLDVRVAS